MVKRTSGRVRKPAVPAGQAMVQHRDTKALNRRMRGKGKSVAEKKKSAVRVKKEPEEYEVEGINAIMREKGKCVYSVKWVGWEWTHNTWEPEEHVNETDEWEKEFKKVADILKDMDDIPDPKKPAGKKGKKSGAVDDETGKQEDDSWEIEQVLGVCWDFEHETIEYLVKWAGWPNKSNTWEPESNMNASELMKPFQKLADYLSRTWGASASGSKPGPKSKKSPAATPAKKSPAPRGRKRPAAASAASADDTEDESKDGDEENEEPEVKQEENGGATTDEDDDQDIGAGDATGATADEDDEEEAKPSPKKRGRPSSQASSKKSTPGKKTPAKKGGKKTPVKAAAKRKSRR